MAERRNFAKSQKKYEAEKILHKFSRQRSNQEQQNIAQIALNSLGNLLCDTDDQKTSRKHFKKAIEIIETLRAPLPAEEFRMAFLADKLAPFENLAKIYLAENEFEKAFSHDRKIACAFAGGKFGRKFFRVKIRRQSFEQINRKTQKSARRIELVLQPSEPRRRADGNRRISNAKQKNAKNRLPT